MLRRSLALGALLALALAVASSSLAAIVHVRVEGKTRTIFGAAEPRAMAANALDALDAASRGGEFYYAVTSTSFGPYVSQVGRYPAEASSGWVFKVNGVSPPVGADQVQLKDGDRVLWYWADFSAGSGPKTLQLSSSKGCYQVTALDDQGKASTATDAVLHVDGRTVKASGSSCIGRHRSLVWASAPGTVRSNALR